MHRLSLFIQLNGIHWKATSRFGKWGSHGGFKALAAGSTFDMQGKVLQIGRQAAGIRDARAEVRGPQTDGRGRVQNARFMSQ